MAASADGCAIHVSPPVPGGGAMLASFVTPDQPGLCRRERTSGKVEVSHPALLAGGGCVGLDGVCHELITSKNGHQWVLSQKDAETNTKLHSDRVLVEDSFGRLKAVFGV